MKLRCQHETEGQPLSFCIRVYKSGDKGLGEDLVLGT